LQLDFNPADCRRMEELAHKASTGTLTPAEREPRRPTTASHISWPSSSPRPGSRLAPERNIDRPGHRELGATSDRLVVVSVHHDFRDRRIRRAFDWRTLIRSPART
jgi:hypothetical protein